ncbi:MAG: glucose-6-phosphate isomerase [Ruminococcaceae bacterium]|nr:glucose-6-phosphate isomerase [Oscillospiraceae bacterium]
MSDITLDYSKALITITHEELVNIAGQVKEAHDKLTNKTGAGRDFLGWVNLPKDYDKAEYTRIKAAAEKIRKSADVLIVIGVGGSYLGAKAAIDMLTDSFYNLQDRTERNAPQILFAGNSISSTYLSDLYHLVKDKDICLNVISKSGTTMEPAMAFRVFKDLVEQKYGKEGARERIFVTTDKAKGALKILSDREGYESFVIADDIGGRYSVLSAVGLLPIAVCGADIDAIMQGAQDAYREYADEDMSKNICYQYAALRNILYHKGKTTEIMVNYEPRLRYFAEWWKQLYGESEGKDHKGIFPAAADFSTELHSIGQYIQDGIRNLFETVLHVENPRADVTIKEDADNVDGLNYLAGKTFSHVNEMAFLSAVLAHNDGGVPNIIINIPTLNEYYFGKLVYFFERACGISGYMLGVNPFDQPGVEAYKRNMFALLDRPGFEKEKSALKARLY